MTSEDLALRAIDSIAEIEATTGRQLLAKIDALVALSKLAKALGVEWAEAHTTAIMLALTKRPERVK